MKKTSLLLALVVCVLFSYAQTASTANTLGTTGVTAINSTTNVAFKLSINGTQKNYGTGDGTGLAATIVTSPTIFLQNTTATTGKMFAINSNNAGLFRISEAVGTTTFTATDRFVINSSGFIGLGNSAPLARLHVKSSGITSATNALLVDNSANTNLLSVRDDGNIGIGNLFPTQKLDIAGNINFAGNMFRNNILIYHEGSTFAQYFGKDCGNLSATGNDNTAMGRQSMNLITTGRSNTGFGKATLYANSVGEFNVANGFNAGVYTTGSFNTLIGAYPASNGGSGNYNIQLGYNSQVVNSNLSNQLNIGNWIYGSNGNIGIGVQIPTAKFQTSGTLKFEGLSVNNSLDRIIVSDIDGNIAYKELATIGSFSDGSETKINAGANVTVSGTGTTASPYVIAATVPVIPAQQWTNASIGTNNITNTNSGGIVIGTSITTLPAGYKMYVQDGILTEKLKVALKSSANWADYVFGKDYKLMPLVEVEAFVNTNKHLPGVQSADELVKDGGVDVNKMFAKQMEKIEELTLYIIEQNKKIEALEKVVKKINQ